MYETTFIMLTTNRTPADEKLSEVTCMPYLSPRTPTMYVKILFFMCIVLLG